jgi:multiple sugar transport system ATP-binding protein
MADIVLDNVVKRYPDGFEAVKNLNLDIADGEFMILVGPSGCGKSTALNMIAGLEDISEGELRIGGEVVNKKAPRDRDIAMVFQSYALYPHMTGARQHGVLAQHRQAPKEEVDRKVKRRPTSSTSRTTSTASRRTCPAVSASAWPWGRAIVRNPKAFLMDEPLSNLDAKLRVQMRSEVSRIQSRLNTTTVYVTPRPDRGDDARRPGGRHARRHPAAGRLADGAVQQPDNLFVAGFIGSPGMNFLPATVEGDVARLPMVDVRLPHDLRERLGRGDGRNLIAGVRPEEFEDATVVSSELRPQGTTFNTRLDLVEAMGSEYYAHFGVSGQQLESSDLEDLVKDVGGDQETTSTGETAVVARLAPTSKVRAGEDAELWIDASKLHFFDADSGESLTFRR